MKPRDIFKLIVATYGLYSFFYGMMNILDGILSSIGLFSHVEPKYCAIKGVIQIFIGVFFIKAAPFVDTAFPPDEPPKDKKDENKSDS